MARLWQCGFEFGIATVFPVVTGTLSVSAARSNTGVYSLLPNTGQHYGAVTFDANKAELFGRVAINVDVLNATTARNGFLALLDDIGTVHLALRINSGTNLIEAVRGGVAGTLLDTGVTPIVLDAWTVIFWRATIADAGGIVQVRIGSPTAANDIAFTGDTRNAGNDNIRTVLVGNQSDNATTGMTCYHDDVAFNDTVGARNASWVAAGGIYGLSPTGIAVLGHTDWTPSAAVPNWQCVDEKPPTDDTDYVSTPTIGNKDTYVTANLPSAGLVSAVQYWLRVRKESPNDARNVRRLFHIGAAEYAGMAKIPPITYANQSEVLESSPATNLQWASGEVDAMEVGVEAV